MLSILLKWIIVITLVADIFLVFCFIVSRSKRKNGRSYTGYFDFDQYKEREMLRRGVIDRARW